MYAMADVDDSALHDIDQFLVSKAETEFRDTYGTRPGQGSGGAGETPTS